MHPCVVVAVNRKMSRGTVWIGFLIVLWGFRTDEGNFYIPSC